MKGPGARPLRAAAAALLLLASCSLAPPPRPSRPPVIAPVARSSAEAPLPAPPADGGPLRITVEEAVLTALENNRSLAVERITPAIVETFVEEERAAFDALLEGGVSLDREQGERSAGGDGGLEGFSRGRALGSIGLSKFFPTGTTAGVEGSVEVTDPDPGGSLATPRLGLSLTQPLLRGRGREANLARLRQAALDVEISGYELRGFVEFLTAAVESAYWDYAVAGRRIEIVQESLNLARQQYAETESMIEVGTLAEAELAAVQAEVAVQQQGLINAQSGMESSRLALLRLLSPPGAGLWEREVTLVHQPTVPEVTLGDVAPHVEEALRSRPEVNQALVALRRGELEIVRTRNGLLPKMDLFATLGKTGYADSFGSSLGELGGDGYDVAVGITLAYPFGNREADARHRRSLAVQDQSAKALDNLRQLVELDVRSAYIEVMRSRDQIAAGTATRALQEEKLRIETEKFRVGRSTSFLVAQAQRDLLTSRLSEVQSVASYLKALIAFYRLEGTLLRRRGIEAPGAAPAAAAGEAVSP